LAVDHVDHEEAGELLLRFRERPIGRERCAVDPTVDRGRCRIGQRLARQELARTAQLGEQLVELVLHARPLLGRQALELGVVGTGRVAPRLRIGVDEDDELHDGSLR
jgi:hypothetical protein